jgi:hypothetical protein
MPDYVGILKRSISSLPESDPAMRQAVYERARSALARQLTGIDPPLSADDIEVQHQHLEDAIREVESELAVEEDSGEAPPQTDVEEPAAVAAGEPDGAEGAKDEAPPRSEEEPQPAAAEEDEPARSSRAPMMIMLALIALILVGAAALAYTQWETVEAIYADLSEQVFGSRVAEVAETPAEPAETPPATAEPPSGPAGPTAGAPATEAEPGSPVRPKSEDRLLSGPDAEDGPNAAQPSDGDAAEGQDQAALDSPGSGETDSATGAAPPSAAPGAPEIPAFDRPAAPDMTGDNESAGLVAQRAIFYEQGEEGSSGSASQGAVAWERVERPQQPPAIVAKLDLPEQNATVNITFTSNADPALPASHLIEVEVEGDAILGPGAIQRVPALVLKPSEQARGQALAGAAVPVTDRLFWIALSDDPEQIGRNLSLLRDGSWFDMPIMYESGERALLTFEKGIPGDRVFETVLAEWAEAEQQSQR